MTEGLFISSYLGIGLFIGWLVIRDGRCESPAVTWLFAMIAGPIFVAAFAIFCVPLIPFILLCRILGIEASDGDSHSV